MPAPDNYKRLPLPSEASKTMASVFGNCEMEMAARRIVRICQLKGSWEVEFGVRDFISDGSLQIREERLLGFILLTCHNWILDYSPPNGSFRVHRDFVKKVTSLHSKRYDKPGWIECVTEDVYNPGESDNEFFERMEKEI